jgi:hypothetical protein
MHPPNSVVGHELVHSDLIELLDRPAGISAMHSKLCDAVLPSDLLVHEPGMRTLKSVDAVGTFGPKCYLVGYKGASCEGADYAPIMGPRHLRVDG